MLNGRANRETVRWNFELRLRLRPVYEELKTQEVNEKWNGITTAAICKASSYAERRQPDLFERWRGDVPEIVYQNSSKSISAKKSLQFFTPCALNSIRARDVGRLFVHRR